MSEQVTLAMPQNDRMEHASVTAAAGMAPAQPLLRVRNLAKYYRLKSRLFSTARPMIRAVDGVSFDLYVGETLGVVGESGCGKSTLSRLIMALIAPEHGEIVFDGKAVGSADMPLKEYRRQVQIVFQDSYSSLNPRLTVEESIAFGPRVHGIARGAALAAARELLELVGLHPDQFARRYPHQLSGGQRQRVNIARALVSRPKLVILDEPVSALDKSVEAQVLNLLKDLKAEFGVSYLLVSHDLNVVRYMSDRILVMYLGRISEIGPVEAIYSASAHPYTAALLASRPSLDPTQRHTAAPLTGDPPSVGTKAVGCRFRSRCPSAEPVCHMIEPELAPVSAGHWSACLMTHAASGHSRAPMANASVTEVRH
jgi:peptide/nickel transport system ATP-binding protein